MVVLDKKSWISSLYLALLVNAQHKNLKTFAALVYEHVYIIWSEAKIKSPIYDEFSLSQSL